MLRALFFDMDETLCDTLRANEQAKQLMGQALEVQYGTELDGQGVAHAYVTGIYREWSDSQRARYLPIINQQPLDAELGIDPQHTGKRIPWP
jgi:N-acylneuraminate-9-phosphatase